MSTDGGGSDEEEAIEKGGQLVTTQQLQLRDGELDSYVDYVLGQLNNVGKMLQDLFLWHIAIMI